MKRDLNLITKKAIQTKDLKSVLFILFFLILLAGLYGLGTYITSAIRDNVTAQSRELDQRLATLSVTKQKFEETAKRKAELQDGADMFDKLEADKKDLPALFEFVETCSPEGVSLTAFKLSPDILELDGYADTDIDLALFMLNLRKNSEFTTVLARQSVKQPSRKKQDFVVVIKFAESLKADPVGAKLDPEKGAAPSGQPESNGDSAQKGTGE